MGARFAVAQGAHAAANIVRLLKKKELKPYNATDPGCLLPMANGRSVGNLLGIPSRGSLPTATHYLACAWQSQSMRTKLALMMHGLKKVARLT
jgi:NADH dehydrogenase FAD-containing subunit